MDAKEVTLEMYDQVSGCWNTLPDDLGNVEQAKRHIRKYRELGSEGDYRIIEVTYYHNEG
jgi:hypothetical protein